MEKHDTVHKKGANPTHASIDYVTQSGYEISAGKQSSSETTKDSTVYSGQYSLVDSLLADGK